MSQRCSECRNATGVLSNIMDRVRANLVLLGMLLGLGLGLCSSQVFAGTVVVTLQLPPGTYTLPSHMDVWARANAIDGDSGSFTQSLLRFDEAAGPGSTVSTVLMLDEALNYTVRYDCQAFEFPLPCEKFVTRMFYQSSASSNGVLRVEDAQVFAGNVDHPEVVLPIQRGNAFTGTVALPGGALAATDINGFIEVRSTATTNESRTVQFTIPSGSNSTEYEIHVPDDDTESWYVGYQCLAQPGCDEFLQTGYYQSASAINTVEEFDDAQPIVGGADVPGINFQLLNGFSISGQLIVPQAVADADGIRVRVHAQDRNNLTSAFSTIAVIEQDESFADYLMTVSLSDTAEWIISYNCDDSATPVECGEYLKQGFYDDGDMVETGSQVDMGLVGGQSHTDIDLTMLTGPTLSGTLQLSQGVAPEGGLNFQVRAVETSGASGAFSSTVVIPAGQAEAEFAVNVGAGVGNTYRLSYNCTEALTLACAEVVDEGFYNATTMETVYSMEEAVDIANGGADLADLVLVVDSMLAVEEELCVPIVTANQSVAMVCL